MNRKALNSKVLAWFSAAGGRAADKNELARALGIPPDDKALLRAALKDLEASGKLEIARGGRYRLPQPGKSGGSSRPQRPQLSGRVLWRNGTLQFAADPAEGTSPGASLPPLVPLTPAKANTALNGDRVVVEVLAEHEARGRNARRSSGPQLDVRVVKIAERRNTAIPGTLHIRGQHAWVEPDDVSLPQVEITAGGRTRAQQGDKVVAAIDDWTLHGKRLRGHLVKRLGGAGERGVDVLGIIVKHRLPVDFPREVLREADAFPDTIPAEEIARREDWRDRHVITIDPFDAKDFDDAIAVTELPNGGFELAVHIADVAHYVSPGTALDREAQHRGNSTYLVDRVLPMLPERLSNGLCSLRPGEDKLTRAAILTYNAKGQRTGQRFVSAVIHSKRRYTYEEAMASLRQAPGHDPDAQLLHRAWKLASRLRRRRFDHGSLDMQFTEVKVVLDAAGQPVRFARVEYDESHQLIEEFMLAANEAVAEALLRSGRPGMYRIHDDPDPAKLEELREIFLASGCRCGDLSEKGEIQKVLTQIAGKPEEHVLKLSLLKSLKRAAYSADCTGHYGLSLRHYTHFTSPIRRYADLIVHRALANLQHAPGSRGTIRTPDYSGMMEIAAHISATERTSADAEMDSRRMKELEYFERIAASKKPEVFKAIITRVLPIGLFVEVVDVQTRGIVRAGEPAYKDYRFDAAKARLVSRSNPKKTVSASDIIDVVPTGIERERGTVVFRVADVVVPGRLRRKAKE